MEKRVIKFRAWLPAEKKMVPVARITLESVRGQKIEHSANSYISTDFNPEGSLAEHTDVATEFELLQFTGLLDRYGKEIYEGDVVKYVLSEPERHETPSTYVEEVVYVDGCFMVEAAPLSAAVDWNAEVIGNVFENPELELTNYS